MMKLLMSWNIRTGREAEYFEFVVKEFAPGLIRLGLQTSEAWYTLYGDCPQMLTRQCGRRPADDSRHPQDRRVART